MFLCIGGAACAREGAIEGVIEGESHLFPERGPKGEARAQASAALELSIAHAWNDSRDAVTVEVFARADVRDSRRTRGDVREAYFSHYADGHELHVGIRRIFWGVVESKHLVDVINQVDLVESIDEESRLGQPMVHWVWPRTHGTLELFWLPVARERTFPSADGSMLGSVRVDGKGDLRADASAQARSFAVRWSGYIGGLEYGLAHFSGPARDPVFEITGAPVPGMPVEIRPVYETLSRTSLDAQYIQGDTAYKLELVSRRGQGPASTAFVAGFEHTFVGAFGTRVDLGVLGEYLFDDRFDDAPILAFEHDVFAGLCLGMNDLAGTELLAGLLVDHRSGETIVSIEGSRRIGERWRLSLDLLAFSGADVPALGDVAALLDPRSKFGTLGDEDHLRIRLRRFF